MTETKEIDTNHTRGNDVQLVVDVVGNMVSGIKTISVSGDGRHINQRHFQRDNILYINNAESADQGIYVCQGREASCLSTMLIYLLQVYLFILTFNMRP